MFLARRYEVSWNVLARYFFFNGADQLMLYSARYDLLYLAIRRAPGGRLGQRRERPVARGRLLESVRNSFAALCGDGNGFDPFAYTSCLPTVSGGSIVSYAAAHFGFGNSGVLDAQRDETQEVACVIGYALLAAVFFIFLYIDTGTLNNLEERVERSVAALPAGHRVVSDIESRRRFPSGDRAYRGSRLHRTVLQLRQLRAAQRAVSRARGAREFDRLRRGRRAKRALNPRRSAWKRA